MARLRTLKPSFFTNEELGAIQPLGRLLFAGLWCIADRRGRLEDRPSRIKMQVLPYDRCNIDSLLGVLADQGFIERYGIEGQRYIRILTFAKHQTPHIKEAESEIPASASEMKSSGHRAAHDFSDASTNFSDASTVLAPGSFETPISGVKAPDKNGASTGNSDASTGKVVASTSRVSVSPVLGSGDLSLGSGEWGSGGDAEVGADAPRRADARPARADDIGLVRSLFESYRDRILPGAIKVPVPQIRARLRTFSAEQLRLAVEHFAADAWEMERNASRGAEWFFKSDQRIESYVHMKPRTEERANGTGNGRRNPAVAAQPEGDGAGRIYPDDTTERFYKQHPELRPVS